VERPLLSLDHLKEGIGLRGYAQKDPIVEFKKEAFTLFEDMMARIDNETIAILPHSDAAGRAAARCAAASAGTASHAAAKRRAAVASAAARASEPQHLPSVAREIERRQQRQQRICSIRRASAGRAPKPVKAAQKWAATIPAPAAPERIRSAMGHDRTDILVCRFCRSCERRLIAID